MPSSIAEGQRLVRECLRRGAPGPYQLQAAIAAVHSDAARVEETDWSAIVALYDQLLRVAPSDIVRLNRAVARAEVDGPDAALVDVESLASLADYHLWHAARGDLLERIGRDDEARRAYERAAELTANDAEVRFLRDRAARVAR